MKGTKVTHKQCPSCHVVKTRSVFGLRLNGFNHSLCKPCRRKTARVQKLRRLRDPNYVEYQRAKNKETALRRYHGIDRPTYESILGKQNQACALCLGKLNTGRIRRLNIDHCSKTLRIRGILCDRCNFALGQLNDDPALVRKAAIYLETADTGFISKPALPSGVRQRA